MGGLAERAGAEDDLAIAGWVTAGHSTRQDVLLDSPLDATAGLWVHTDD
jgi:hypothetical protein